MQGAIALLCLASLWGGCHCQTQGCCKTLSGTSEAGKCTNKGTLEQKAMHCCGGQYNELQKIWPDGEPSYGPDVDEESYWFCSDAPKDMDTCVFHTGGDGEKYCSTYVKEWYETTTPRPPPEGTADEVCFPHTATVHTPHGRVSVGNLQRGDQLLSPNTERAEIAIAQFMTDAHAADVGHAERDVQIVEISHELMQQGRPLQITAGHFLYKAKVGGEPVLSRAGDVHKGDFLFALAGEHPHMKLEQSRVTNVTSRRAMGAFSPQTTSGRLIVDGVAVSSFAATSDFVAKIHKAAPWSVESLFKFWLIPTRLFYELSLPLTGQVDLLSWLPSLSLWSASSSSALPYKDPSTLGSAADTTHDGRCTDWQNMDCSCAGPSVP